MEKVKIIAVYGGDLVMSSFCASLQKRPEFELQDLKGWSSDGIDTFAAVLPDAILFDLAAGQPDFAIPLLQKNPTILLIGVDLASHKMLVLSGEQSCLLTADDLMHVLAQGAV